MLLLDGKAKQKFTNDSKDTMESHFFSDYKLTTQCEPLTNNKIKKKKFCKNNIFHLPLLVSRKKFFFKSNSHESTHPLSITEVRDFRHESPNLLEIILSGSQMPSFTYPSDIVCVDPDVGDGLLWTRGRLSSVERNKPMVSRFTFSIKENGKLGKIISKNVCSVWGIFYDFTVR